MDVNDVTNISSNLSSLNDVSSSNLSIDKSNSSTSVNKDTSKEPLKLTINEYNQRRDELSASLQTFTQGIGISRVAISGLEKQSGYLQNIESKLNDIKENNLAVDDKNTLKNDMNKELLKFRNEAYETTYKNEKLIALDDYEERPTISIDTKELNYSLDKPNTPEIATSISQSISSVDLNNPDSLINVLNNVKENIKTLDGIKEQFTTMETQLKESAKSSIEEQMNLSNEQRKNKEVNFGKESNDFTKNNVMANMGYLAASQANIIQEQSVRLLS